MGEAMDNVTRFECTNSNYISAREDWGVHVDHCEDCERSPFACEEGDALYVSMGSAFNAARRAWEALTERQKAQFMPKPTGGDRP